MPKVEPPNLKQRSPANMQHCEFIVQNPVPLQVLRGSQISLALHTSSAPQSWLSGSQADAGGEFCAQSDAQYPAALTSQGTSHVPSPQTPQSSLQLVLSSTPIAQISSPHSAHVPNVSQSVGSPSEEQSVPQAAFAVHSVSQEFALH
jgi:hypothetical protein